SCLHDASERAALRASCKYRAWASDRVALLPLGTRLPPDVGSVIVVRGRQAARAAVLRAELDRDALRSRVLRVDDVNDLVPAEMPEGPVDRSDGRLGRVAAPPTGRHDHPADLRPRPTFRHPRADPTDPLAARLLEHREHREALEIPRACDGHGAAPCR